MKLWEWKWTVVITCPDGKKILIHGKDKYRAGMHYDLSCAKYGSENVDVYDPDGEYCDPSEL